MMSREMQRLETDTNASMRTPTKKRKTKNSLKGGNYKKVKINQRARADKKDRHDDSKHQQVQTSISTSTYPAVARGVDPNKVDCNVVFAQESRTTLLQYVNPGKVLALVLDSLLWITGAFLEGQGFNEGNIYSPERDKKTYDALVKLGKGRPSHETMLEFLLRATREQLRFGSIWLDYMGSWGGSKDCRPQEEIKLLFLGQNPMLNISNGRRATLAITLCLARAGNPLDAIESIIFIQKTAHENHCVARLSHSRFYGHMGFLLFAVTSAA